MLLYPKASAAEHAVGTILKSYGSPGAGWVLCDGSDYLKSSYTEYVNKCIDLHPLRFLHNEKIDFTNTPSIEIKSIAINGDVVVMVGGTTQYHWRSANGGDTWTEYSSNLPSSQDWRLVRYANSQFVAVGYNSTAVAYSSDGITWSSATLSASGNWEYLYWDGTQWILCAAIGGTYYTSPNGSTWTQRTGLSDLSDSGIAIDLTNNELMILNGNTYGRLNAYHSTDGINWTQKKYLTDMFQPYNASLTPANLMYFPNVDKWVFTLTDHSYGPEHGYVSYDDGANWTIEYLASRHTHSRQDWNGGTLWDGNCHIWCHYNTSTQISTDFYYMLDGNVWTRFNGPGQYGRIKYPHSYDAEYENFMMIASFESGEADFDYVYKFHYGDYDPSTRFAVPKLEQGDQPGFESWIKLQ